MSMRAPPHEGIEWQSAGGLTRARNPKGHQCLRDGGRVRGPRTRQRGLSRERKEMAQTKELRHNSSSCWKQFGP